MKRCIIFRIILLILCALVIAAAQSASLAAEFATANFVAAHDSPQFARQVAETAEQYRKQLALYWLDRELPAWHTRCPITIRSGRMGAGGSTTFAFDSGEVFGWKMTVQGSPERILDSVIPHEVNHTIFATHFRRKLPRWYDEGAACSLESEAEKEKYREWLRNGWRKKHRIGDLFDLTEYPRDMRQVTVVYGQSVSVAEYLLSIGDARTFIRFGETALRDGWNRALERHYGARNVNEFEADWIIWVNTAKPSRVTAAAISPDKPDLVVITSRGCLPCRPVKEDARAGGYADWNVIFIEWDGKAKTWGVPWTYTDGRQELHGELDAAQLYRQFQEQTDTKQGVQAPHFWLRYTKHHFPGKHNVKAWLRGLGSAVVSQVIDEPPPIAATEPVPGNSTPFAPAPTEQQYQRSTDSRVDGLLATVKELRADVAAAVETAKEAKEHGTQFSEAGLIGKARAGMALKSDVAELRERAGKVKDGMTELVEGLKNPANWLHVGWGIFAAWYRKRKGTA